MTLPDLVEVVMEGDGVAAETSSSILLRANREFILVRLELQRGGAWHLP